jgi:septal ring factor EnvC (AmiA/AmiB activator)
MRSSRSAQTTPGTACPVRDRGTFVMPPRRASFALGLAAFMLLAPCALIPAHATDANEPESSSVASDLEQEQEASRLELRSVADEAKLAAKALAALEADIAALRNDQQDLDRRINAAAARRAELDERIAAGETAMVDLSATRGCRAVVADLAPCRACRSARSPATHRSRSAAGVACHARRCAVFGAQRNPAGRGGTRDSR